MMGVVKSHASLPFEGDTLARYLRLPQGHRSSVFAPESSLVVPVFSWALRLWNPDHKDLFHGLIRLEVPPTERSIEEAPVIARHLMAERAPLSTPDRRWDRLLYGFHDVEMFLKAGGGGGAPNIAPVLTLQS